MRSKAFTSLQHRDVNKKSFVEIFPFSQHNFFSRTPSMAFNNVYILNYSHRDGKLIMPAGETSKSCMYHQKFSKNVYIRIFDNVESHISKIMLLMLKFDAPSRWSAHRIFI
jgi:hypothetical protein